MQGQDGIIVIVWAGKHGREGTLFEFSFDLVSFRFQFRAQAFIFHLRQFEPIADAARKTVPVIDLFPKTGGLLRDPLGRLGLIPEARIRDLFFQFCEFGLL